MAGSRYVSFQRYDLWQFDGSFQGYFRRPVYLSDSPKEFVKENIFPLIDKEGKIFPPGSPAIPTPESVLTNPLQDGKAYRVFAPTGDEAVSVHLL